MATPVRRRQLGPFAVRSTEILNAEGGEEHHTLRRSVGALDLTALGVGATIGTGILVVIGEGAGDAGPAVTVSFVLAALHEQATELLARAQRVLGGAAGAEYRVVPRSGEAGDS